MNDQVQPGSDDPAFDDPGLDEVRALLADARVTEPVPDDVAARLDATLSSLQARRAAEAAADAELEAPSDVVVPLRRRLGHGAGRVLVAAAVLAVVGAGGVGIAQLAGDSSGGANDSATSADRAQDGSGGSAASGVAPQATGNVPRTADGSRALPELTTTAFAADAARVMVDLAAEQTAQTAGKAATPGASEFSGELDARSPAAGHTPLEAPPVTASPQDTTDSLTALGSCTGPEAPGAVVVPATLDGGTVALVFRPPTPEGQRVEAWSCDGGTLLQAATVPTG